MHRAIRPVWAALVVAVYGLACDDPASGPRLATLPQPPGSAAELVDALAAAYDARDIDRFEPLFHPEFVFSEVGLMPVTICRERWICLHRELFASTPGTPKELWLVALTISVNLTGDFVERPEFYASPTNPEGLDSVRWNVTGNTGVVSILFETQGETDYQIMRIAHFVVAEDRAATSDAGRFTFYRIDVPDIRQAAASESKAWSAVLALYDAPCAPCPEAR